MSTQEGTRNINMADIPREVGVEGALRGAHLLSRPAEEFGNDPSLEAAWVMKTVEHMEVYFNLLCSVDPRLLRLTPHDDAIYKEFRETFPDFPVSVLCEDKIKSEESKVKWRPFCNKFEGVVEDYNFGTLVRIDSSAEYLDENSILVPRIQFYAIEIARNREGCNDGIRAKFKPTPRNKDMNSCWIIKITNLIEEAFKSICDDYNLSHVAVRKYIYKESGSEHKGDFSVLLGIPQMKQFLPYAKQVVHHVTCSKSESSHILYGTLVSDQFIRFTLDRSPIFREVISEISKLKEIYGSHNSGQGSSVLIAVCSSNKFPEKSLVHLRSELIAEYLASVFKYNGFQVFLASDSSSRMQQGKISLTNIEHVFCSEACNTDNLCQVLLKQAKDSKWRRDPDGMGAPKTALLDVNLTNLNEEVVLDSRRYLEERYTSSSYKTYFKKLDSIYVQANGLTESFNRTVHLEHILNDHISVTPKWIIHVAPECKAHVMRSSGLLFEMLREEKSSYQQVYMTHVTGSSKSEVDNDGDYLYGKIKREMEEALVHKYGPDVVYEKTWIPCINILTETAFKFNLLTKPSSPPKTSLEDKNKTIEKKQGTFVQYNCARLFRLFKRHEQLVNEGRYSKLPEVGNVDFSLLKLEEEWSLFFNYVLPFPKLVKGIYEDLQQSHTAKVRCSSSEVCRMLIDLSQDLSLYYNRTRILVEPVPHLQKTMAARLWLLRAIHQIMKNGLALFGIEALEKM